MLHKNHNFGGGLLTSDLGALIDNLHEYPWIPIDNGKQAINSFIIKENSWVIGRTYIGPATVNWFVVQLKK
jgi:hypothetical protein